MTSKISREKKNKFLFCDFNRAWHESLIEMNDSLFVTYALIKYEGRYCFCNIWCDLLMIACASWARIIFFFFSMFAVNNINRSKYTYQTQFHSTMDIENCNKYFYHLLIYHVFWTTNSLVTWKYSNNVLLSIKKSEKNCFFLVKRRAREKESRNQN